MSDLAAMDCERVNRDSSPVSEEELNEYRSQVPEWDVLEKNGARRLRRTYKFDDFKQALEFTNRVGELAEEQDHHPVLTTEWGKVTVTWWTHVIGGLHRNDFIMAAKSDQAYKS